jgi:hypothetical protein
LKLKAGSYILRRFYAFIFDVVKLHFCVSGLTKNRGQIQDATAQRDPGFVGNLGREVAEGSSLPDVFEMD